MNNVQDTTIFCLLSPDLILNIFNTVILLSQIPLPFWSCGAGYIFGIHSSRFLDSYSVCAYTHTSACAHRQRRDTQSLSPENLSTSISSAFPGSYIKDFGGQCAGFCEHIYECLYLPNFHGDFSYLNSILWIFCPSKKSVLKAWQ